MSKIVSIPVRTKIQFFGEDIIHAFLLSLAQKDLYTYQHCFRVGYYAKKTAQALKLSEEEVKIIEYSGRAHDIGKIGIPDNILLKPGKLNAPELKIMQQHPLLGYKMLLPFEKDSFIKAVLPAVKHHHEQLNGQGYPDQLTEDQIPLYTKIVSIADFFDAMTTHRVYNAASSIKEAYKTLKKNAGIAFDPTLVDIFCSLKINNIIHMKPDFFI